MKKNKVLLSFDVEEFDLPREHGDKITLKKGVEVSSQGLETILEILEETKVRVTFFVTGNFASLRPEMVKKMERAGHEVACHGVDHFKPSKSDVAESKKIIEKITRKPVKGYRQPRMFKIDYHELKRCDYKYDSSVNPAFIPGRYNNFRVPRKPYKKSGVIELPTSVATFIRVPLFWLALHLFPKRIYLSLVKSTLNTQGYFATYFHPWEFVDLGRFKVVPWYIQKNSGENLADRLKWLINELKQEKNDFITYSEFLGV